MISNKTLQEVFDTVAEIGIEETANKRGVSNETIRDYLSRYDSRTGDNQDIIESNVKVKKQIQKFQDINRIERKAFREYARIENAVTELNQEFITLLKEQSFNTFEYSNPVVSVPDGGGHGMIQFTDYHVNELVELPNNRYDIHICSKRTQKFIATAIAEFLSKGVSHVLVAFTGDMLNSDRRLDEKLNMASNRVRAQFLAIEIFKQAIEELAMHFNVHVASVTGNESRINQEFGWSDTLISDSYDYSIHNVLRLLFENHERVTFCGDCSVEKVIEFGGKVVLLIHGNQLTRDYDKSIAKVKARYADVGILIDYIIFGHLHETHISALYARSGSPVGANAYSENGLQLTSRASQNLYFFQKDGIDGRQVLLQDVEGWAGYEIHDKLMMYNTKSASKLHNKTVVFQVVT